MVYSQNKARDELTAMKLQQASIGRALEVIKHQQASTGRDLEAVKHEQGIPPPKAALFDGGERCRS